MVQKAIKGTFSVEELKQYLENPSVETELLTITATVQGIEPETPSSKGEELEESSQKAQPEPAPEPEKADDSNEGNAGIDFQQVDKASDDSQGMQYSLAGNSTKEIFPAGEGDGADSSRADPTGTDGDKPADADTNSSDADDGLAKQLVTEQSVEAVIVESEKTTPRQSTGSSLTFTVPGNAMVTISIEMAMANGLEEPFTQARLQ